jgi:hypothetical protein
MFGAVFGKVTGLLSQRFVMGLVMPMLVFLAGIGALIATLRGWTRTLAWWSALDSSRRTLLVVAFVCVLVVLAIFLGTAVLTLTQLLEGYWSRLAAPLTALGRWRQRKRQKKLEKHQSVINDLRVYQEFPDDGDLLPTRLGNALRSAERYPGNKDRWALDAVFWWSRLSLVLPDPARQAVEDARANLDQLVVLTWLATAFGLTAGGLAAAGLPLKVWAPCAGGGLLLARFCYLAAVSAAVNFGEQVRSCFDLYRTALLTALGWEVPERWADERALWTALQQQLYRLGTNSTRQDQLLDQPRHTPTDETNRGTPGHSTTPN